MSPWLYNVYMDDCMRKMKASVGELGPRLKVRGMKQSFVAGLFAYDSVFSRKVKGCCNSLCMYLTSHSPCYVLFTQNIFLVEFVIFLSTHFARGT